jgi:hypothetical protein
MTDIAISFLFVFLSPFCLCFYISFFFFRARNTPSCCMIPYPIWVQLDDTQNTTLSPSDIIRSTVISKSGIAWENIGNIYSGAFKPMLSESRVYIFDELLSKM